ncbi:carboxylic ester hydrolase [Marinicauda pacifica]|uniref:Carboxylic ester hydrolase n=1 Tax=Marinicauda pacifica TaxID=1133559 RepID=A0A4S2H8V1_9PROT|nr:carboxylesterase family protein [Marinicauda pacifica]TGY92274.1 carboxylesterase/lipase family protein [Marinicauda pacifica]GGE47520.1 carboxylic ester hydrolase [Marinicauda pacifica]
MIRLLRSASAAVGLACLGSACAGASDSGHVLVEAPAGPVRGVTQDGLEIFKGIPFAAPPVGEARWAPPTAMPAWDEAYDATEFGPGCMQPGWVSQSIYTDTLPRLSEDCLNLNIWAPAEASGAPVVVWIHGGALVRGANSLSLYDGASYAERGVVFVSINYRLGVLGYLAHPELSAESPDGVSGNYGLLDQIAALEWVEDNIAAFGGDPQNVTIAGESAGALSVTYLMASPLARGLFDKAIAQSAYTISTPSLSEAAFGAPAAETAGVALAEALGAEDVADLRAMDAETLVDAAGRAGYLASGTVDGLVLPDQIVSIFDRGEQAPVPVIAGFNEGEIRSLRRLMPPPPADEEAYEAAIRRGYGELAETALAHYPPSDIEESMLATTRDAMYGWSAERLARDQSEIGQAAYYYYYHHGYPAAEEMGLHAFHASELPYMFDNLDRLSEHWPAPPDTPDEAALADAMTDYWVSFARDGHPAAEGQPAWPPYSENEAYMLFDDAPRGGRTDLLPGMFELHEAVMCRRRAADIGWHWNVGVIAPPLPAPVADCS